MVRDFFVDSFGGLWGPGRNCGLGGAAIGCQATRFGVVLVVVVVVEEEDNIVTGQNSVARHN